jgi:hypothetical protein
MVEQLATDGFSADVIAARLNMNKNTLRARHALQLKAGRDAKLEKRAEAEAAELRKSERARLYAIKQSFESDWYSPEHGNPLFGDTHSVEEALAWCIEQDGGGPCRWITTGLSESDLADEYDMAVYESAQGARRV